MPAESSINHTEFLSSLAHELRNPLTFIYSTLQLIEQKYPDLSDDYLWKQLYIDIKDLNYTLSMMVSSEYMNSSPTQVINLNQLIDNIEAAWMPAALHAGISLSFATEPLPTIVADPLLLRLALTNLIKNSLEATSVGGSISVTASIDRMYIVIKVHDDGEGIAPEKLNDIFRPYYTSKPSGTGIGLYLTERYITYHQGTIHADSQPNLGTTFTIQLPIT